jgi:hypothetical protein
VIHDSFFLSEYQVLNLFVCGVGTVGGSLIEQIRAQQENLMKGRRLILNVVGIASGHNAMFDRNGLSLEHYREDLKAAPLEANHLYVFFLGDIVAGLEVYVVLLSLIYLKGCFDKQIHHLGTFCRVGLFLHQLARQQQHGVTGEDGGIFVPHLVYGRFAAAHIGAVHHIVVQEGEVVIHLNCHGL